MFYILAACSSQARDTENGRRQAAFCPDTPPASPFALKNRNLRLSSVAGYDITGAALHQVTDISGFRTCLFVRKYIHYPNKKVLIAPVPKMLSFIDAAKFMIWITYEQDSILKSCYFPKLNRE